MLEIVWRLIGIPMFQMKSLINVKYVLELLGVQKVKSNIWRHTKKIGFRARNLTSVISVESMEHSVFCSKLNDIKT